MSVASGTIYTLHDAWEQFLGFYGKLIEHHAGTIAFWFAAMLVLALVVVALRRGVRGAVAVIVVFGIIAVLSAMMLPALSKAKSKAQRVAAMSNLKQVGLAAKTWAMDNGSVFPPNIDAMVKNLGSERALVDPKTGQRFIYVGTGKTEANPEGILAYSPSDTEGRAVLFADGSVQIMSQERFDQAMQRDAVVPRLAQNHAADSVETAPATPPQSAGQTLGGAFAVKNGSAETVAGRTQDIVEMTVRGPTEAPVPRATATGVRPIRIEIPRAGQAFNFTKVLNTGREPLNVSVSVTRLTIYRTFKMVLQVCLFVLGLGAFGVFWIRSGRQSSWARHFSSPCVVVGR